MPTNARGRLAHRAARPARPSPTRRTAWRTRCAAGPPGRGSCATRRRGARGTGAAPARSRRTLMSAGRTSFIARRSASGVRGPRDVEVRDLLERVHAGVGAAGALEVERGAPRSPRGPRAAARPARCARSSAPASRCSACRRIRSSACTAASRAGATRAGDRAHYAQHSTCCVLDSSFRSPRRRVALRASVCGRGCRAARCA